MRALRAWFLRLGGLFAKQRRDRDLAAELESHVQIHADENMRAGMPPQEARRQALIRLGGVEQTKENYRDRRSLPWLESLVEDTRFGLRMLRKNPGFTAVAILTLALGIGANTAVFSVVDATLLNPIPLPQPDRLVSLFVTWPSFSHAAFSYPNFLDLQREGRSFSGVAGWRVDWFTLTGAGEPLQLHGKMISSNVFPLLGIRPILGRTFRPEEDQLGAAPVAILSEGLWKGRFGSRRDILGQNIVLNAKPYTIVGVVPADIHFLRFQDSFFDEVFVPVGQWDNPLLRDRRFSLGMQAVARLRPGVTLSEARTEMDQIAHALVAAYPDQLSGMGIGAGSMKELVGALIRPALLLLWGAVGLVLLIACANVANLLLARSSARDQEFAVRVAMGASRARLVRQLLAESVLLAMAGGALGVALAMWGTPLVLRIFPSALPPVVHVQVNRMVLAVALGISLATGILFGIVPALKVSSARPHGTLKEGGRGAAARRHRTQGVLVVAEIALSLTLLVGAGLLVRSFARVWAVNPGFESSHLLTFGVGFSPDASSSPEKARTKLDAMTLQLESVPGVQRASVSLADMPLEGDSEVPFWPTEKPKPAKTSEWPITIFYYVGPQYFQAMGIPLIQGRVFTFEDGPSSQMTVVIDQSLAESIFPGQNPIGKTLYVGPGPQPVEVVGVVGHVKQWGLDEDAKAPVRDELYFNYMQLSGPMLPIAMKNINVVVRSSGSPAELIQPIRKSIASFDGTAVVYNVRPMDELLASSLAERRFSMTLLAIFAGIALLLATIGIYGVVSYLVGLRTHEIGIRIALGAQKQDILAIVLGEGGKMALAGIALGLVASLELTRFMSAMLFGVSATDPVTYGAVALVFFLVALVACWIPARRAIHVDPMLSLRHE